MTRRNALIRPRSTSPLPRLRRACAHARKALRRNISRRRIRPTSRSFFYRSKACTLKCCAVRDCSRRCNANIGLRLPALPPCPRYSAVSKWDFARLRLKNALAKFGMCWARSKRNLLGLAKRWRKPNRNWKRRFQLRFGFRQRFAKPSKFRFDRAQHMPNFARAFFNRKRAKSHLETAEYRGQGGRAGNRNPIFALQRLEQSRTAQHFSVQAFDR